MAANLKPGRIKFIPIMRESHACGSKIVLSRIQTNFSRLTDNSKCNCIKTD